MEKALLTLLPKDDANVIIVSANVIPSGRNVNVNAAIILIGNVRRNQRKETRQDLWSNG